jgi:hypothetical protein
LVKFNDVTLFSPQSSSILNQSVSINMLFTIFHSQSSSSTIFPIPAPLLTVFAHNF